MKKKKIHYLCLFLAIFITINNLYAVDTLSVRFFPMHTGDFWVYLYHYWGGNIGTSKVKYQINVSIIKNNHVYYKFNQHMLGNYNNKYLRADSVTGSLYNYDSLYYCSNYFRENIVDSLAALSGDSVFLCSSYLHKCDSVILFNILGYTKIRKEFFSSYHYGSSSSVTYNYLSQDFGLSYHYSVYQTSSSMGGRTLTLLGCKINGIVYGDTSTTEINEVQNNLPEFITLFQNYPNPFNPETKIKYQIINNSFVNLKIFDILGKKIHSLVNTIQNVGEYEVIFDGSGLPSGIYFYRLTVENSDIAGNVFTETRKMILLK